MRLCILLLLFSSCSFSASAAVLYALNFDSPLQGLNQPVLTGNAQDRPTSILFGQPLVVQSAGDPVGRELRLDMLGNPDPFGYDQIRLTIPVYQEPVLTVDFDFTASISSTSNAWFSVIFDTPSVRTIGFKKNGQLVAGNDSIPNAFVSTVASHARIYLDLQAHAWSIFIDQNLVVSAPFTVDSRVQAIRLSFGMTSALDALDDSYVTIDNFTVTTIPEPATVGGSVILLAGAALATRRRKHVKPDFRAS